MHSVRCVLVLDLVSVSSRLAVSASRVSIPALGIQFGGLKYKYFVTVNAQGLSRVGYKQERLIDIIAHSGQLLGGQSYHSLSVCFDRLLRRFICRSYLVSGQGVGQDVSLTVTRAIR